MQAGGAPDAGHWSRVLCLLKIEMFHECYLCEYLTKQIQVCSVGASHAGDLDGNYLNYHLKTANPAMSGMARRH